LVSVSVDHTAVTLGALGDTVRLIATGRIATGSSTGTAGFAWSSSRPDVATVDPLTGLVTAVKNGTSTVSAAKAGISGAAVITVLQVGATLDVKPDTGALFAIADSTQFPVTVADSRGHPLPDLPPLSWLSRDETVVKTTSTGYVRAV